MWALGEGLRMTPLGEITLFPHFARHVLHRADAIHRLLKFGDEYKIMGLARTASRKFLDEFRRIVYVDRAAFLQARSRVFHVPDPGCRYMTWRDSNSTPVLGRLFPRISKNASAPRASPTNRSSSATTISQPACKVPSKKSSPRTGPPSPEKTGEKSPASRAASLSTASRTEKYLDHSPFERVYVQPAAGDAGLPSALAFAVNHQILGRPREFVMDHAGWGPQFSAQEIRAAVETAAGGDDLQIAENLDEAALLRGHRTPHRRRQSPRLVSRPLSNGARARSANAAFSPTRADPK